MSGSGTIGRIAERAEREGGDDIAAFRPVGQRWMPGTWKELGEIRREVAASLARFVQPGERVAILSQTRWEWGPIDLAILSLGATTVGIYPTSTPAQIEYILVHSRARVLIVEDTAQLARLKGILPDVRRIVIDASGEHSLDAWREKGRAALAAFPEILEPRLDAVKPSDVATLVYTSGTTGPPKAVALTHEALLWTSLAGTRFIGATKEDVAVSYLPMAHVLTRVNYYGYLQVRGTGWYAESMEKVGAAWLAANPTIVASVPRVLEKAQAKILAAVAESPATRRAIFARALKAGLKRVTYLERGEPLPALLAAEIRLWQRVVYSKVLARLGWTRVRFAMCGGAPLRPDVARFFHALGVTVIEGFGMTETASPITLNTPSSWRIGSVGRALPGIALEIAADGEILVRSPGLFARYDGDEKSTREAFDERGFFKTGDVGTLDAEGFLRITDRKRDLIITSGGKNVAPQNIEALIREDGRVSQVAVFGEQRPYLVALVTLAPETQFPAKKAVQEIVDRANAKLAPYETIKKFRVLTEDFTVENDLLTPTLKVKRRAVQKRYQTLIDEMYDAVDARQ